MNLHQPFKKSTRGALPCRDIAPGRISRNAVRMYLDPVGQGTKLPYHVREMLKILFHFTGDARRATFNGQRALVFDERVNPYPIMLKDAHNGQFKVLTYERQTSGSHKLIWEETFVRSRHPETNEDTSGWTFRDYT